VSFALLIVIVGALVTARLTRLVSADRVLLPVRQAIVRRFGPSSALGYLVHCRWCVSMWIAPFVAAGVLWLVHALDLLPNLADTSWPQRVLLAAFLSLAYSHVTALLAGLEDED
jgi:hypothetical protein